jgi:hypothetical protein
MRWCLTAATRSGWIDAAEADEGMVVAVVGRQRRTRRRLMDLRILALRLRVDFVGRYLADTKWEGVDEERMFSLFLKRVVVAMLMLSDGGCGRLCEARRPRRRRLDLIWVKVGDSEDSVGGRRAGFIRAEVLLCTSLDSSLLAVWLSSVLSSCGRSWTVVDQLFRSSSEDSSLVLIGQTM